MSLTTSSSGRDRLLRGAVEKPVRWYEALRERYRIALAWALTHRVAVVGGAKLTDKIGVLEAFLERAERSLLEREAAALAARATALVSHDPERALERGYALLLAGAALAAYVVLKYAKRQRIFRELRMARITPDELRRRIDAGDGGLAIIDTRSALDVRAVPFLIPGAIRIDADEVERRHAELPKDLEIVLYCT